MDEAVVTFRLDHGLCHGCGTRLFELDGAKHIIQAINIPGVSIEGRCLFCYPEPAEEHQSSRSESNYEPFAVTRPHEEKATAAIRPDTVPSSVATPSTFETQETSHAHTTGRPTKRKRGSSDDDSAERFSKASITESSPLPSLPPSPHATDDYASAKPYSHASSHTDSDASSRDTEDEETATTTTVASSSTTTGASFSLKVAPRKIAPKDNTKKSAFLRTTIQDGHGLELHGIVTKGNKTTGAGEFKNIPTGGGGTATYSGEFLNGKVHGKGTQLDSMGCLYKGEFKGGLAHGRGLCTWPSGWVYDGEWVRDLREGKGECRQTNGGQVYKGEWKQDMWHGKGELTFAGGDKYIGEFKEDKMHGHGVYIFLDGTRYEGEFKNDFRNGQGAIDYEDGSRYEGEWKNNWRDGRGIQYENDGTVFEGTFKHDVRRDGYLRLQDGFMRPVKNGRVN